MTHDIPLNNRGFLAAMYSKKFNGSSGRKVNARGVPHGEKSFSCWLGSVGSPFRDLDPALCLPKMDTAPLVVCNPAISLPNAALGKRYIERRHT